ncbi:hypothetical protein ABFS82_08G059800 [Erythranthe guttata]|uniref:uncharacterized protein LOC105975011 n=1 Tax=Erythranthe guttata TaxID=4155 RepID=UPI00064DE959|nr:PREDICTED: uncharacterized protein LOC105975011 [Erythranthe guttata]|eukprot:XP_012855634.1 PREDICTED: uncharacterized protein LOC105975011 [Erythranthe guttata]
MSSKRVRKQSKFMVFLRRPFRVLARARDLTLKSLTGCGGNIAYGNAMGCPTPQIPSLPRSFSTNASNPNNIKSAEEELKDLLRLASVRGITAKVGPELRRSKSSFPLGAAAADGGVAVVPRSNTVGFGRIDEDRSFHDFGEEDKRGLLGGGSNEFPRSRSHAAASRKVQA